jgi:hypothetical protein
MNADLTIRVRREPGCAIVTGLDSQIQLARTLAEALQALENDWPARG